MSSHPLIFTVVLFLLWGCADIDMSDQSLVTSVERLNSPDNRHTFYRYYVQSPMAFGTGSVRLAILDATDSLDYSSTDFFTVDSYGPVVLGWKNSNTLKLIVLTSGRGTDLEPYDRKIKQWKGFAVEIDYYHMYSAGSNPYQFDSCKAQGDTITFWGRNLRKSFVKGKAEITFDQSMFNIREIATEVDSAGRFGQIGQVLVTSKSWELTPAKPMDFSKLISSGVLIQKKFKPR